MEKSIWVVGGWVNHGVWGRSGHPTSHVTHLPHSQNVCLPAGFLPASIAPKRHHAVCVLATCDKRHSGNSTTAVKELLALRPQPGLLSPQCQRGADNIFPAASCLALRLLAAAARSEAPIHKAKQRSAPYVGKMSPAVS